MATTTPVGAVVSLRCRALGRQLPVVALLVSLGGSALGQTGAEVVARRELLTQAQTESTAGHHAQALELAERAGAIQMSPSVRMFIAQEQTAVEHYADALGTAELCVREATRDATLANRDLILSNCRTVASRAESQVGYIVIVVPSPAPAGLSVRLRGNPVSEYVWNVRFPVDPGSVQLEATADRGRRFSATVTIASRQERRVQVELAEAPSTPANTEPDAGATVTTTTTTRDAGAVDSGAPDTAPPATPGAGPPIGPIVLLSVGAAGLIAGAVVAGVVWSPAVSRFQTAYCTAGTNRCSDQGAGTTELGDVTTGAIAADVLFGVGGAVAAAGLGLLIFGGRKPDAPRAATVVFTPLQGGGFVTLYGAM